MPGSLGTYSEKDGYDEDKDGGEKDEDCVESTMLFNCNTKPIYKSKVKQLQKAMDRRYRLIWVSGNKEPLREMEVKHVNMWDVRRQLGVESFCTKIEIAHFRRIDQIGKENGARLKCRTGGSHKSKGKTTDDTQLLTQTPNGCSNPT